MRFDFTPGVYYLNTFPRGLGKCEQTELGTDYETAKAAFITKCQDNPNCGFPTGRMVYCREAERMARIRNEPVVWIIPGFSRQPSTICTPADYVLLPE